VKILIADDDPQLQRALRITLVSRGYDVVAADDGAQAIELAARTRPDVMILDLGMPNVDGIDVIRAVRAWSKVPILVLSGRTDSAEKVDALDAGADDYVTKPFAMDEFLARIRARARVATDDDLAAEAVVRVRNPGKLLTRQMLLTDVWGPYHANDAGYLRLYVAQLRRKLEPVPSAPRHFLNEPGLGYRFEP
jgi:two-component system KDP operon response regulator KdpE